MTKMLKEVMYKVAEYEDVQQDDKLVLEWMDDIVYRLHAVQELYNAAAQKLPLGKYDVDKDAYEENIELCAWDRQAVMEAHIYKGLEILAKVAGAQILTRGVGTKGSVCHYFIYKDVEFFEITEAGEILR